ncbi:Dyp-type peroxidase [Pseudonocardia humida]|uniref:Dyp-type peroxidase n=1 Tax=Pseudonocardia humida TaxID=2800819 RepID=A0ABT0ZXZ9_9PSEU|nr:Dyp-type peroxidase [Pseudonocardia humida]MCO1655622.1 Dyp-type peroxidase [Pseudonocardia humida]
MPAGPAASRRVLGRRGLLLGGAAALGGGAVGALGATASAEPPPAPVAAAPQGPVGADAVPFHGRHQSGITTAPVQAHAAFVALDLRPGSGADDVARLLRLLSDDAARLTAGRSPLGADDPELVALPSRLTVTFGFGPGLFDAIGRPEQCPAVVRALPAFATDRIDPRWSGGDLLLQVCSDDRLPLSYAVRRLVRDARGVATVRWTQRGFGPARGSEPAGTTPRNLFGQRDGSKNPEVGGALDDAVWVRDGPDWFVDGSMLVLRRIRMDLDVWDDLGREARELSVGRSVGSGAPVTGGTEFDEVDPTAVDGDGFAAVPPAAHALRAKARGPAERMLRRGFSYDDGPTADGAPEAGLLFAAYQADAATAFVPVQARLAESDVLNLWVTHTGSAAFAVPPGCAPGEYVGGRLLEG